MESDPMAVEQALASLMDRANSSELTSIRLNGWRKVVEWKRSAAQSYFWESDGTSFLAAKSSQADFVLHCSADTLHFG
jgi:hypothetical protein